jgi:hypothetical protein
MWDPCTGAPRRPAFVRRRPRHTHRQLQVASSTAGCASRAKPASSTGRASRASPTSLHRPRLSRQAGLHLCHSGLSRRAGLRGHRLRFSAPSRSPTPPPNDAAPANCSRLPRPRLAVRDRHASCGRSHAVMVTATAAAAAERPATSSSPSSITRPPQPPPPLPPSSSRLCRRRRRRGLRSATTATRSPRTRSTVQGAGSAPGATGSCPPSPS